MDHQSGFYPRPLRFQTNEPDGSLHRYIKLLCLAKGLKPETDSTAASTNNLTIHDADFPVTGVINATDYIDERYPFPPIMPTDAKLRALARMTIEQALAATTEQLSSAVPQAGFLFSRTTPTAADLAIAAAMPRSIFAHRVLAALQRDPAEAPDRCCA